MKVQTLGGKRITVEINDLTRVNDFLESVCEEIKQSSSNVMLMFDGKNLTENVLLIQDLDVQEGDIFNLVARVRGA